jgi:hypothetical protein
MIKGRMSNISAQSVAKHFPFRKSRMGWPVSKENGKGWPSEMPRGLFGPIDLTGMSMGCGNLSQTRQGRGRMLKVGPLMGERIEITLAWGYNPID